MAKWQDTSQCSIRNGSYWGTFLHWMTVLSFQVKKFLIWIERAFISFGIESFFHFFIFGLDGALQRVGVLIFAFSLSFGWNASVFWLGCSPLELGGGPKRGNCALEVSFCLRFGEDGFYCNQGGFYFRFLPSIEICSLWLQGYPIQLGGKMKDKYYVAGGVREDGFENETARFKTAIIPSSLFAEIWWMMGAICRDLRGIHTGS